MKHLDDFKIFEARRKEPEMFPSEEFGQAAGLDWIYKEWKLPSDADSSAALVNKAMDDLENSKTADAASASIIGFYKTCLKLNPELSALDEPKTWNQIYDHCMGIISRFTTDDINFYASMDWGDKAKYNMQNRPKYDAIAKKAGHSTGFVMSPTTIKRVYKELGL